MEPHFPPILFLLICAAAAPAIAGVTRRIGLSVVVIELLLAIGQLPVSHADIGACVLPVQRPAHSVRMGLQPRHGRLGRAGKYNWLAGDAKRRRMRAVVDHGQ